MAGKRPVVLTLVPRIFLFHRIGARVSAGNGGERDYEQSPRHGARRAFLRVGSWSIDADARSGRCSCDFPERVSDADGMLAPFLVSQSSGGAEGLRAVYPSGLPYLSPSCQTSHTSNKARPYAPAVWCVPYRTPV